MNSAGSANTGAIRRSIEAAEVPISRSGSSMPNMGPKLWLTCVIRPCSSVMTTPGIAAAIRRLSSSV